MQSTPTKNINLVPSPAPESPGEAAGNNRQQQRSVAPSLHSEASLVFSRETGLGDAIDAPREFIIFLDDSPGQGSVSQRAQGLMRSVGIDGNPALVFDQLNGFALCITTQQARLPIALGGVKSIDANAAVFLDLPVSSTTQGTSELAAQAAVSTASLTSYNDIKASSGETLPEVGAFYWTVPAPEIVNPGRDEQDSLSV